MKIKKLYFTTEDGANLFGLLHKSENSNTDEVVITTHGMGSSCLKPREDFIAKKLTDNRIDCFTYNNRGFGLINNVRFLNEKRIQGTVFEDVQDGYFDILGAIKLMLKNGYQKIHLQGHSLGATKTVYTYNKLIENNMEDVLSKIKSVILLSLVDLTDVINLLIKQTATDIVSIALEKERLGQLDSILETGSSFLPYVSPKTFLRYYRDNAEIDFAKYTTPNYNFEKLNNINVPLFMRWGNVNELISMQAKDLVDLLNEKIANQNRDISYIDGANHGYAEKEDVLAEQIIQFLIQ